MAQVEKMSSTAAPIVGVLVGEQIIHKLNAQNSRFKSYIRFQMIMQANAEARDIVYIFCNRDVSFARNRVRGTYFNKATQRWEKKDFPLPNVLYVRGGSGEKSRDLLNRFDQMGVSRINPITAFDKWDLFYMLQQDDNINSYLPFTERLDDVLDLERILQERSDIYIKGCRGSRGKRVMRVSDLGDGSYEYSHYVQNIVRRRANDLQELMGVVKRFFGNSRIIVQQAIDLWRTDDGRLVDFRAEVQRNEDGEVAILGTAIRVGRNDSPITIHSDAYKLEDSLSDFCPNSFDDELVMLEEDISHFLKSLYTSVERVYGTFGEIGIDFGIDYDGGIWLIECNAQSAKVSLEKAYGREVLRKSYLNPLKFAKLLSQKSPVQPRRSRQSNRAASKAKPLILNEKIYATSRKQ